MGLHGNIYIAMLVSGLEQGNLNTFKSIILATAWRETDKYHEN